MGSITIYHIPGMRSDRCVWLYHEMKAIYGDRIPALTIETFDREEFKSNKTPEFLALNPNGKLPLLVDGDLVMWDSCAICLYLLDRYDSDNILFLKSPAFRSVFYQLSFYVSGTVDELTANASPIQRVMDEINPNNKEHIIKKNEQAFKKICGPILDKQLGSQDFMFGNDFTALDVIVGKSLIRMNKLRPSFLEIFPTLKQYALRMAARPNFQKVQGINN